MKRRLESASEAFVGYVASVPTVQALSELPELESQLLAENRILGVMPMSGKTQPISALALPGFEHTVEFKGGDAQRLTREQRKYVVITTLALVALLSLAIFILGLTTSPDSGGRATAAVIVLGTIAVMLAAVALTVGMGYGTVDLTITGTSNADQPTGDDTEGGSDEEEEESDTGEEAEKGVTKESEEK